jgi:hypothetical protein
MELSNFVLLQNTREFPNVGVSSISETQSKNPALEVSLANQTWTYNQMKNIPIGKMKDLSFMRFYGPIGVYDVTNIDQLNQMIKDALVSSKDYQRRESPQDISLDLRED